MKKQPVKCVAHILLIFLSCTKLFALDAELYALDHTSDNHKEIEMVQNRLYSQLAAFPGINAIDKRTVTYTGSSSNEAQDVILIHATIQESDAELFFTIYAEQPYTQKKSSVANTYLSYYKILTEIKSILQQLLTNLDVVQAQDSPSPTNVSKANASTSNPSFEMISGTWTGEPNVNKILLLRGGRGFVIFKNGASMNIAVKIEGDTITCTQTGRSNASFFPDLPREVALVAALNAEPIKWVMTLVDDKTLTGTKESLHSSPNAESVATVERTVTQSTWIRQ